MSIIKKNITGFILAGGKSSRMGLDKGLLLLNGKPMICHAIEYLNPFVSELIIVTNNPVYENFGFKIVNDRIKDAGPVGGIYTALEFSTTEKNFIVSCDMPFITANVIGKIINKAEHHTITIANSDEGIQPLCGIYSRACIPVFSDCLKKGMVKLREVIKLLSCKMVDVNPDHSQNEKLFGNINTPLDLLLANKNR